MRSSINKYKFNVFNRNLSKSKYKTDFIKLTITIPRKQQKEPNLNSNDYVDYNPRTGNF